jgi:hypothetical protein
MHKFVITRYQQRRTNRQNRYYWPCFVQPFADFMRSQGEAWSDEDAHEMLKLRCNPKSSINPVTGEMFTVGGSTKDLTIGDFNAYLDRCAVWLLDNLNIMVPEPDVYRQAVAA